MNTNDYIYLLNHSRGINENQTLVLTTILNDFPFFQSARALCLKGLKNQESFRYNFELKKTAAHTNDRSVLFDFITTEDFNIFRKETYDKIQQQIQQIQVNHFEIVAENSPLITLKNQFEIINETEELPVISESDHQIEENSNQTELEVKLEIGKPLIFEKSEKHSFNEWLKLSKFTPIEREKTENSDKISSEIEKKFNLIEKFIEANPKIQPAKENTPAPVNIAKSNETSSNLMTETLAKIYLEQKKYTKAIQAYEILILKYPEKSSFFANRIKDIKSLQQNN